MSHCILVFFCFFVAIGLLWGTDFARAASRTIDGVAKCFCSKSSQLYSIYEYRWSASDTVRLSVFNVFLDFSSVNATIQRRVETCTVQSEISRILLQRRHVESLLILEKNSNVLEKFSLGIGSVGRLCCL